MTNLVHALTLEPKLPQLVGRLVAMAGAITVPGNITPTAETNVWNDPDALATVLTAGFDLTLVSLDVTRTATATREWLQALADDQTQLWGQYAALLLNTPDGEFPALPLHDPLAAAVLIDPAVATLQKRIITVSTSGDELRGQTQIGVSTDEPNTGTARVATAIDHARFLRGLLASLQPSIT